MFYRRAIIATIELVGTFEKIAKSKFFECTLKYTREVFDSKIPEKEIIAIDGKTIRNSKYTNFTDGKKSHKASYVVSAFASSMGICFGRSRLKKNQTR